MRHGAVSQYGKIERRAVEGDQLRVQFGDFVDKRRDQFAFGSVADMGCPNRIDDPLIILVVRDQRTDANNLVVDVLSGAFERCFGPIRSISVEVFCLSRRTRVRRA